MNFATSVQEVGLQTKSPFDAEMIVLAGDIGWIVDTMLTREIGVPSGTGLNEMNHNTGVARFKKCKRIATTLWNAGYNVSTDKTYGSGIAFIVWLWMKNSVSGWI